jgi:hypothetical protein
MVVMPALRHATTSCGGRRAGCCGLTVGAEPRPLPPLARRSPRPGVREEDLAVAGVLADSATTYLINASTLHHRDRLDEQLTEALDSRVVIEPAEGITANERGNSDGPSGHADRRRRVVLAGRSCAGGVELRGFEPLTPSMRTRCATGLRHSPLGRARH